MILFEVSLSKVGQVSKLDSTLTFKPINESVYQFTDQVTTLSNRIADKVSLSRLNQLGFSLFPTVVGLLD